MAGATLTTLSNVLKEMYIGNVNEQFNNDVLVAQILQLDSKNIDLEGNEAVIALHTARSGGIGSRDELETLPSASNQSYKKAVYDLKYHYARIQVSGQSIQKTKSNVGAFLRAYESELDMIRNDLQVDFARQAYGDGTGFIATIPTGAASATQTLSSDEALQKGFLYVNMVIDVGTTANPSASASGKTITDVDVVNKQITVDSSFTSVNSDKISRSGDNKASATKEMDAGLQKLIATSANTVGGIDASAAGNRIWDNMRDTSGGALTLDNLMVNLNKVKNAGVKNDDLLVLTTPGLARRLFASSDFKSNVRFVNDTQLDGGFSKITFAAGGDPVSIVTDRLAPYGLVNFIPRSNFRLFSPGQWDFLAKDGQAVKWVQDKDAFQSVLFRYANLGTNRRNNSLVMSGLTDTGF